MICIYGIFTFDFFKIPSGKFLVSVRIAYTFDYVLCRVTKRGFGCWPLMWQVIPLCESVKRFMLLWKMSFFLDMHDNVGGVSHITFSHYNGGFLISASWWSKRWGWWPSQSTSRAVQQEQQPTSSFRCSGSRVLSLEKGQQISLHQEDGHVCPRMRSGHQLFR